LAHSKVAYFDPPAARDPNDAWAKRSVRPLFVGVAERAAEVRNDVVDTSQRDGITIPITLLNEI
jgi:hypothetical protein